jgi:hypothetical protein
LLHPQLFADPLLDHVIPQKIVLDHLSIAHLMSMELMKLLVLDLSFLKEPSLIMMLLHSELSLPTLEILNKDSLLQETSPLEMDGLLDIKSTLMMDLLPTHC